MKKRWFLKRFLSVLAVLAVVLSQATIASAMAKIMRREITFFII